VRRCTLYNLVFLLSLSASVSWQNTPQIVYGTYLGGRDKDCATALAVDSSGNAYIVGRTPSSDFPVTAHAFSAATRVNNNDWTGFVSKLSPSGGHLVYSSFLGGNFRSAVNAIVVDAEGVASVVGSTCSADFPTTASAVLQVAAGSDKADACDGFVARLSPDGSRLEYGSYLGGSREDAATAVALSPDGNTMYVGGYTFSPDFTVTQTAAQAHLNGLSNGFFAALDTRSGRLLYSTYLGGSGEDGVTGIAVSRTGAVYVAGVTRSTTWQKLRLTHFGKTGGTDGFIVRLDPSGRSHPFGIRIGGSKDEILTSIGLDSHQNIYVVGSTSSPDFPLAGVGEGKLGSGFVIKIDGRQFAQSRARVLWSRRIGGHGRDALLSVSAGTDDSIFVAGRSGSKDFSTTPAAIYRGLEADNDSILLRLSASDGRITFASFLGGSWKHVSWYNDEATGVVATASGDVYVTGCTIDHRLPVTRGAFQTWPKGNSEPFVLRIKFRP
jgi:hypothetical protein